MPPDLRRMRQGPHRVGRGASVGRCAADRGSRGFAPRATAGRRCGSPRSNGGRGARHGGRGSCRGAANGVLHYLWRAVQHGVVLDILVQERRDGAAAKRFFRRLLKGLQYKPKRLITDGLRRYGVARRALLPDVKHRTRRYLNNRAENSHRPTRRRERQMQRFKSRDQAQDFLSAHAIIYGHFRPPRHCLSAVRYRCARTKAFRVWQQETCVQQVG
jgi:hypothetical protein